MCIDVETDIIFARLWETTVAQITMNNNETNEDQKVIYFLCRGSQSFLELSIDDTSA